MRSVLLVFNPLAGTTWKNRRGLLGSLTAALQRKGVKAVTTTTRGPDVPPAALFDGLDDFDTVIACGGDGTVNEVLQAIMASDRDPALAVVPFGSGNLLARELGIRRHLPTILTTLQSSVPQPCPVGVIEQLQPPGRRRYWLAAAGVGADARVICDLSPAAKQRFGISAYYAEATRQLLFRRHPFPSFSVEFEDASTGTVRTETVTQAVAERIGYFGRFLEPRHAAPLDPGHLRVVLFKTRRRASYMTYGIRLLAHQAAGHRTTLRDIEVVRTPELTCAALPGQTAVPTLAEVDGELLGPVPVRIALASRRIRLIRPAGAGLGNSK